jgi:hypothetical protein
MGRDRGRHAPGQHRSDAFKIPHVKKNPPPAQKPKGTVYQGGKKSGLIGRLFGKGKK